VVFYYENTSRKLLQWNSSFTARYHAYTHWTLLMPLTSAVHAACLSLTINLTLALTLDLDLDLLALTFNLLQKDGQTDGRTDERTQYLPG